MIATKRLLALLAALLLVLSALPFAAAKEGGLAEEGGSAEAAASAEPIPADESIPAETAPAEEISPTDEPTPVLSTQSDALCVTIDYNGFAYVKAPAGTALYGDASLNEDSCMGELAEEASLAVTAYLDNGAVEVWLLLEDEAAVCYARRSQLGDPLDKISALAFDEACRRNGLSPTVADSVAFYPGAALLRLLPEITPATPEADTHTDIAPPSKSAQSDALYAAIDDNGFAYVKAPVGTVLYGDASLSKHNRVGELLAEVKLAATAYADNGAVEVWLILDGETTTCYVNRSQLGKPLNKAQTMAADADGRRNDTDPTQLGNATFYTFAVSIKPLTTNFFEQLKIDAAELWKNITAWWQKLVSDFQLNFIVENRWQLLLNGLRNTLLMTAGALGIGVVIGVVIALVRTVWETNGGRMHRGPGRFILRALNGFFRIYTTIFRGTPMMVQLLLMAYVVFSGVISNALVVAIISFGLNSGAYVSEIFRGGINSIDKGQMEAGRSVGMSYAQAMWHIIAPQVIKNVLPTLANEFITLIKETSIAAYAGVLELTMAGNRIRGRTFSDFMPLIAVAIIYLALVMLLTWLVGKLERRLRQSDAR